MIEKNKCFLLGYIAKSSGLKGGLLVNLDVDQPENYQTMESVFLDIQGELIPFFVKDITIRANLNSAVLYLEDIETVEQSETLIGAELYLPLEVLPALTGKKFYYHEVKGFEVIDSQKGSIGIVEMVIAVTAQPVFQIINKNKEILIPAVDEIIDGINREEKKIYLTAPEGLINIYID